MARVGRKLRSLAGGKMAFMCPGCAHLHAIKVGGDERPRWVWNNDGDAPTFYPSVLVTWPDPDAPGKNVSVCHSYITDGLIRFLPDSTHHLAGQTVALPDLSGAA